MHWNECAFLKQLLGGIGKKLYYSVAYSSVERCRHAPAEELSVESHLRIRRLKCLLKAR